MSTEDMANKQVIDFMEKNKDVPGLEAFKQGAELNSESNVVKWAEDALKRLSENAETIKTTSDQVTQIENLGGSAETVIARTGGVDEKIELLQQETAEKIEEVTEEEVPTNLQERIVFLEGIRKNPNFDLLSKEAEKYIVLGAHLKEKTDLSVRLDQVQDQGEKVHELLRSITGKEINNLGIKDIVRMDALIAETKNKNKKNIENQIERKRELLESWQQQMIKIDTMSIEEQAEKVNIPTHGDGTKGQFIPIYKANIQRNIDTINTSISKLQASLE